MILITAREGICPLQSAQCDGGAVAVLSDCRLPLQRPLLLTLASNSNYY